MTLGLRNSADLRSLGIVATYYGLLGTMLFIPDARVLPVLVVACAFSFLTAVVNHNTMHLGPFESKGLNNAFRCVLSFAAMYPVSANIPSHNLVHHQFDDDGQDDWAAPNIVNFKWNLLNLIHFPNVAGPLTFAGVNRWMAVKGRGEFRKQHTLESFVAFGGTGLLLAYDFWTTLFFIMVPQLWGARSFLRINIIQHDGTDVSTEWNHSRNFVGRFFNYFMLNNGFHTIHHNRATLHWTLLREAHDKDVAPRISPELDQASMAGYLFNTYILHTGRPVVTTPPPEKALPAVPLPSRAERMAQAEAASAQL